METERTTKGMFFRELLSLVNQQSGPKAVQMLTTEIGLPPKFSPVRNYPARLHVLLQEHIARLFYPNLEQEQGVYELGRYAFATFMNSYIGKVSFQLMSEPKILATRLPSFYQILNKYNGITIAALEEKRILLSYLDYFGFPQQQQGMMQAGLDHMVENGRVGLEIEHYENDGNGNINTTFELTLLW